MSNLNPEVFYDTIEKYASLFQAVLEDLQELAGQVELLQERLEGIIYALESLADSE